ncbi:hypothetical protein KC19_2G195900 [Ceratodon purpureus]|uniref:Uncharacterized protein n=1 Tax=Ceratodon purpureus TaxID=3225 RepID=A0A8T0IY97_CERPU|nr:hypothetical protein KC19_2G195900 [Ceratodon purpureus]
MYRRTLYTKLPPQCNMLELVPPRRSKMFLKWQDLRKKDPPPGLKPKPKERLHIWQKVERDKEENVLEDYYWFYEEWDRINKMFIRRFYKTFPELLMERIHHYRIKVENAILLAGCILTLAEDDDSNDPSKWEESLRKYPWFPSPGVPLKPPWDDGSNDKPKPVARPEDIAPDRVGRADRDNPKFEYFKDRWAHLKKGEDDWGAWEKFCFKMAAAIARAEPHYPDFVNPPEFGGLLILGKRLKRPVPEPPPPKCPPIPIIPPVKKAIQYVPGPAAMISLTYHFFVNQVGEQSIKSVLLENVGETVLFYTWERRPMEALITTPKAHLGLCSLPFCRPIWIPQ